MNPPPSSTYTIESHTPAANDEIYTTKNYISTAIAGIEEPSSDTIGITTTVSDMVAAISDIDATQNQEQSMPPSLVMLNWGKNWSDLSPARSASEAKLYCTYYILCNISRAEVLRIMNDINESTTTSTAVIPKSNKNGETLSYHTNCFQLKTEALKLWANISTHWGPFSITNEGRLRLQEYLDSTEPPVESDTQNSLKLVA
jgi:hypothetical protein